LAEAIAAARAFALHSAGQILEQPSRKDSYLASLKTACSRPAPPLCRRWHQTDPATVKELFHSGLRGLNVRPPGSKPCLRELDIRLRFHRPTHRNRRNGAAKATRVAP